MVVARPFPYFVRHHLPNFEGNLLQLANGLLCSAASFFFHLVRESLEFVLEVRSLLCNLLEGEMKTGIMEGSTHFPTVCAVSLCLKISLVSVDEFESVIPDAGKNELGHIHFGRRLASYPFAETPCSHLFRKSILCLKPLLRPRLHSTLF